MITPAGIDVKEIVKMTVKEMFDQRLVCEDSDIHYKIMSKKLVEFFKDGKDEKIQKAIVQLGDSFLVDIIKMYYGERMTIEQVARKLNCDVSTVVRNKKKSVLKIYDKVHGAGEEK